MKNKNVMPDESSIENGMDLIINCLSLNGIKKPAAVCILFSVMASIYNQSYGYDEFEKFCLAMLKEAKKSWNEN